MSESNYYEMTCPFCNSNISKNEKNNLANNLEDDECDFFQCQGCNKFLKISLRIHYQYEYEIEKPTNEEIIKHNLINEEDSGIIKDVEGQTFMWD